MAFTPAVTSAAVKLPSLTARYSVAFMARTPARLLPYAIAVTSTAALLWSLRREAPAFTPNMFSDTPALAAPVADSSALPTPAVLPLAEEALTPARATTICTTYSTLWMLTSAAEVPSAAANAATTAAKPSASMLSSSDSPKSVTPTRTLGVATSAAASLGAGGSGLGGGGRELDGGGTGGGGLGGSGE